jgi:hypothetical protein
MPSENFRRPLATVPMGRLIEMNVAHRPDEVLITSGSWQSVGPAGVGFVWGAIASAVWVSANRALFVPFAIAEPMLAEKMFWANGTVVGTDSIDVGIYTTEATPVRLVSGGGTLSAGISTVQEVNITDTVLLPGAYYMAMVCNSATTATFLRWAPGHLGMCRLAGMAEMAAAYVLPSTATLAAISTLYVPFFGVAGRVLAA